MSELKVGDKVRVLKTTKDMHWINHYRGVFTKGDESTVCEVLDDRTPVIYRLQGDRATSTYLRRGFLELVEDTSKRRPHSDTIIAWANGAEVEICSSGSWYLIPNPNFDRCCKYRIKETDPKIAEIKTIREEMNKLADRLKELEK